MSIIFDYNNNNENLIKIIIKYNDELAEAEKNLKIEGKTLQQANMEQATWQFYYDERKNDLYTLTKYLEQEVDRVKGKLWRKYTEVHSRELTYKDKEQYINSDKEFLDQRQLYLQVEELYKKYVAVVDAFSARGYALRNITNLRVAALENLVL